jgi:hypothetical protein
MTIYSAAFRSRSQAMRFFDECRAAGLRVKLCGAGCEISVVVAAADYREANGILNRCNFSGFVRWY